ncbi:cytochrome b-c1 complex subunit 10, mitochondrial [[Candida] jaroonii]|uniref:Cytochrome b-c1 complex subunit 10, mitochondrial n=1 Tax=[Candida] jaroonii TaxID=467808 RepID=A0ACA9Y286_9ASCO|nr:cytochrome b-c1 complex subunit 10, mitochondrial [[Candida] jaroonii]
MVSYSKGPSYKPIPTIIGLNAPVVRKYTFTLALWGGAAAFAIATFTEGVPLLQNTFYKKIPYFGERWVYNPDPEDVPV